MDVDSEILVNLSTSQGRIEGKLDSLIETMSVHLVDDNARFDKQDRQLHLLEKKANFAAGIISFLIFIVSPVLALFGIFHK